MNLILVSTVCAWLVNQAIKVIIAKKKERFFECGGMPSSHSALVSALSTSVGLLEGFDSAIFLITLIFSAVIVHDAVRVRKQHTLSDVLVGIAVGIAVTLLVRMIIF
jgi:acid phosphatase family membrane protein YuiD